jgi:predicted peptidase
MRLIKVLATCSLIAMSITFADNAFAQRSGGGGGGGGGGGTGGGQSQGSSLPAPSSNRSPGNRESLLDAEQTQPTAAAEIRARIQSRSYKFAETGQKMPYAVLLPRKLNKKKATPLVIALHDEGTNPESILAALGEAADRRGYILVAPQGYTKSGWYGYGQYIEGLVDAETSRLSERDVMNVLDNARVEYKIDPKRIYIIGHSMGGIGAIYLGAKYPDIWAAVGAISPRLTNQVPEEIGKFDKVPIVVEHGDRDELTQVELIRAWVAGLKEREVVSKYYEYRGGTNQSPLQGGAERVFDFFDKQIRMTPAP